MPGWRVHRYLDMIFFGKSYSRIHRKIDQPYVIMRRRHRVFFHDPLSAKTIAEQYYPGDPQAVDAAYLHILADNFCTADPYYKRQLEMLALLNRPKRRASKKRKKKEKEDPSMKRFLSDIENMAELRRLYNAIFYRRR